jgi:fumarate hydratase subunit beta
MKIRSITTPLADDINESLKVGEKVLLSGFIYTARDSAHKRFISTIKNGESLPIDLHGQVIYYCGPSPAAPGRIIGSAGPTTSSRMDSFTPTLIGLGLKGMIGKGRRSQDVINSLQEHKAVYFGATGGAGALLAQSIESYEIVAYDDLGPEAVSRLFVRNLPLFVVNDVYGGDMYEIGASRYRSVP